MKRVSLFIFSAVLAFILVEFLFQEIIGFPAYEVEKKLTGIRGAFSGTQNVFKPNSCYFTVEGGLKIYRRNNLGFSGLDVDTSRSAKYIAILGNSFVEAYQVPPESTAVGILQKKFRREKSQFEVINLGVSGHDPMDLLYRLVYYNKSYRFDKIVLVITSNQEGWLNRHKKLEYEQPEISINNSIVSQFSIPIRNYSVLIDLFIKSMNSNETQNDANGTSIKNSGITEKKKDTKYSNSLIKVFNEYHRMYNGKLIILNICNSETEAIPLPVKNFLQSKEIKYRWEPIVKSSNLIGGNGHLNIQGNSYLGNTLYEILK